MIHPRCGVVSFSTASAKKSRVIVLKWEIVTVTPRYLESMASANNDIEPGEDRQNAYCEVGRYVYSVEVPLEWIIV